MQTVKQVAVHIVRGLGRLPDSGDKKNLVGGNRLAGQGLLDTIQNGEITASRAPSRLILAEIFNRNHIHLAHA